MRQSEVLKEFAKLTDNQKDTIRKTIEEMVRVNENLSSSKPDVCPVCGNGSGSDGDGLRVNPKVNSRYPHYKCFA
ncbi:MAG: hypothetical protein U0K47_01015, partial [Erysipelotrichaceae bacterium]|nr:hypothetical protein [Erysipelotrichaceae bacterium]